MTARGRKTDDPADPGAVMNEAALTTAMTELAPFVDGLGTVAWYATRDAIKKAYAAGYRDAKTEEE